MNKLLKIQRRKASRFLRAHVSGQNSDKDERASKERVKRQLHGAVFAIGRAPGGDEKILWNNDELVKDEEEKQIRA